MVAHGHCHGHGMTTCTQRSWVPVRGEVDVCVCVCVRALLLIRCCVIPPALSLKEVVNTIQRPCGSLIYFLFFQITVEVEVTAKVSTP